MVWWCGMALYGMVMAALGDNPALIGRYLSTFRPGDILFQRHHFLPTMFYIIARHLSANIIFERHYFLSATWEVFKIYPYTESVDASQIYTYTQTP